MQWHQLDHMQTICTSLKTDNHTNTSSLKFYRLDALTDVQPTLSKNWRQRHCFTITIQCYWIQKSMASGRGMPYAHTQTDGQVKNIMSLWPQRTGGGCIITWYFKCLPLHMQSPPLQFICIWCQLKKSELDRFSSQLPGHVFPSDRSWGFWTAGSGTLRSCWTSGGRGPAACDRAPWNNDRTLSHFDVDKPQTRQANKTV